MQTINVKWFIKFEHPDFKVYILIIFTRCLVFSDITILSLKVLISIYTNRSYLVKKTQIDQLTLFCESHIGNMKINIKKTLMYLQIEIFFL